MSTSSPRRARTTAALLAVGLLAGCGGSSTSAGTSTSTTPTEDDAITFEAGAVEVVPFEPVGAEAPAGDGQPLPGTLITPHTAQELTGILVTDELRDENANLVRARLDQDFPTAAPEGHELVVVTLSAEDLLPPYAPDQDRGEFTVVVDGTATRITPFGAWSAETTSWATTERTYVVVAPVDAPVQLQVADAGRTATLDLRTGARSADEGTRGGEVWYGPTRASLSGSASSTGVLVADDGTLEPLDLTVTVSLAGGAFLLSAWHPTLGWAAPGRAWGTARAAVDLSTPPLPGYTDDPGRVFVLSGPDGSPVAPVGPGSGGQVVVGGAPGTTGGGTTGATWDLPADGVDGSTLQVRFDVDWTYVGRPASWSADVPALPPVTLSFS